MTANGSDPPSPVSIRVARHKARHRKHRNTGRPPTHGFDALTRTLTKLGTRALDGRSAVSKQLVAWRADLIRDLGGEASVSTQQATLVDLAVRQRLIVESVDAWLFEQPTLVDVDKKALLPVVRDRQGVADSLARYLLALGLDRREPEPEDAIAYMRRVEREQAEQEAERARRIAEEDSRS